MSFLRRLLAALTHSGPGYTLPPLPARDDVETWLRAQRDAHSGRYGRDPAWYVLDDALDQYRLHADTETPLNQHLCEGLLAGECECTEVAP